MHFLSFLRSRLWRAAMLALGATLFSAAAASAADIHVVSSGGFAAAYRALAPAYEQASGNTLTAGWGPSMGKTVNAIPNRLQRHEPIDVVIMVDGALQKLINEGKVLPDSRVVLAASDIGMAVRAGAPKPDIGTVDALRQTLLNARSIAYSDSASGVYLSTVLFHKLGIAKQLEGKAHMIPAEPVGQVVARGDAELGFQQVSELLPVKGIDFVGELPAQVQHVTLFSAGVVADSHHPDEARALIRFLASPAAAPAIEKTGLHPGVNAPPSQH